MITSNKGIIELQRVVNGLKYDVKNNQENLTKAMRDQYVSLQGLIKTSEVGVKQELNKQIGLLREETMKLLLN